MLPVKTHERRIINHVQGSARAPAIIINHRKYENVMDAARKLRKDRNVIRKMLQKGEARYA